MSINSRMMLFALVYTSLSATSFAEHPNILWITSEDHGPNLGCYGDTLARTPNIDALAKKGMLFKRVWSCAPVCAPARTAIISGIYPSSSGGLHMRSMVSLPRDFALFPTFLRSAGYYCTNHSKEDYNVRKPDKLWDESSVNAHWSNRPNRQPFFAIFNSDSSHESRLQLHPPNMITDPQQVRVPAFHPDVPEVRLDWARYYDIVSLADAEAGRRLKEIDDSGLADDTIIFYYSDHGSGMPRCKRWPSNSGLQVPLIVYFPERWRHLAPREYQPGSQSDRMVNFVDLAPTMLSLVGIEPPEWMQGHAFAGHFASSSNEKFLHGQRGRMDERIDTVRSVTDGQYVYIRNYFTHVSQGQLLSTQLKTATTRIWKEMFDRGQTNEAQSLFWQAPKAPEELYDLRSDADEVHNLATLPQFSQTLERLRQAQHAHALVIRDVCFLPEGEMHSRSVGSTPYEISHDDSKYPLERILSTAEIASNLDPASLSELSIRLTDADSAVRYWAVLGFLMRGHDAVHTGKNRLKLALNDESPCVRIFAAQALAQYGNDTDAATALGTLDTLLEPKSNGVLVSFSALYATDNLGPKAAPLHAHVSRLDPIGPSPDPRFDNYIPRLINWIGMQKQ